MLAKLLANVFALSAVLLILSACRGATKAADIAWALLLGVSGGLVITLGQYFSRRK
jgi:hypothetical protein